MKFLRWILAVCLVLVSTVSAEHSARLAAALAGAGTNRPELERALSMVPSEQRAALGWLIERMPTADLSSLRAEFLVEHCEYAFRAWRQAPWHAQISEELFLEAILPYASVNERRDAWRKDFYERFLPLVKTARSPGEAAVKLNQQIFPLLKVSYSTKRKKADQSPYETIETGLASCSGLSILLIDACRAVGVPARFVGTPLWSDKSGNHSWVEVWDQGWQFTGAAEPSGDALNQAWFVERAAGAKAGDPLHAIFATTWRDSPQHFPLVWLPEDRSVRAIDVTQRYLPQAPSVAEGLARVRFRVRQGSARSAHNIEIYNPQGVLMFRGTTKDERFDANDHLSTTLALGGKYELRIAGQAPQSLQIERDEQLVDVELSESKVIATLREYFATHSLADLEAESFAQQALTRTEAELAQALLWEQRAQELREQRALEHEARALELGGAQLKFWYTSFGEKPARGRSLWISMHGGGGAPTEVNDKQWENQKRLYTLEEGIYVAPRAPTDTWNLWHQAHIDALFARLIENMIVLEGVDPNRVYILGYSAGGDGVYQLAPRMADQLAAAGMMAGHPNETQPDGLRNLGFALHMGAKDSAYNRNAIAAEWKTKLAELASADPGAYAHQVVIHEGKGHWMDREDRAALPWMAQFTREPNPTKLVWLQDDVTHARFYWLAVDEPKAGTRIVAQRTAQTISIEGAQEAGVLRVRLADSMLDLDREVLVIRDGVEAYRGVPQRTLATLARCLLQRADPQALYSAELLLKP